MGHIIEVKGNLFESNCQTIVNTVNCVGVMGKGIALEFKYRFPDMYKEYVDLCNADKLRPGLLFFWNKSKPCVLNFPTKDHWKGKSKLKFIELGLQEFVRTYKEQGITSIAFPRLGTTNGELLWAEVKSLMYEYLEPLYDLKIEIYNFDPNSKDRFFDDFKSIVRSFDLEKYQDQLKVGKDDAIIIKAYLDKNKIHSMFQLQRTHGLSLKSIGKIYSFTLRKKKKGSEDQTLLSDRLTKVCCR